jgi:hypothetical protein
MSESFAWLPMANAPTDAPFLAKFRDDWTITVDGEPQLSHWAGRQIVGRAKGGYILLDAPTDYQWGFGLDVFEGWAPLDIGASHPMTAPTEEAALRAVEEAKARLAQALEALREARGEPADEPCRLCGGTGKDGFARMVINKDEPCYKCEGSGRRKKLYPWIVTGTKWDGEALRPSLLNRGDTWVSVRPCDPECGGKTYLGWLLGDLALGQMAQLEADGTLKVIMAHIFARRGPPALAGGGMRALSHFWGCKLYMRRVYISYDERTVCKKRWRCLQPQVSHRVVPEISALGVGSAC